MILTAANIVHYLLERGLVLRNRWLMAILWLSKRRGATVISK